MAKDQLYMTISTHYICHRFSSFSRMRTVMARCCRLHENTAETHSASLSLAPDHTDGRVCWREAPCSTSSVVSAGCAEHKMTKSAQVACKVPTSRGWFSLFALHMERRVVELNKQSVKNTFGLLANERGRVETACWAIVISSQLLNGGKSCESLCTRTQAIFIGVHRQISRFFTISPGIICSTFTIMASSVVSFPRQRFKLRATGLKSFYLGKAQGRRTLARGRSAGPEEETKQVAQRGWNDDISSKFRHVLHNGQKVQEVHQKAAWGATGTSNIQFAPSCVGRMSEYVCVLLFLPNFLDYFLVFPATWSCHFLLTLSSGSLCCFMSRSISDPSVCRFSFRVMFFSRVSSKTACSFLLISSDRSRVSPLSAGWEVYSEAMMPPRRLRWALLISDASDERAPDSSLST